MSHYLEEKRTGRKSYALYHEGLLQQPRHCLLLVQQNIVAAGTSSSSQCLTVLRSSHLIEIRNFSRRQIVALIRRVIALLRTLMVSRTRTEGVLVVFCRRQTILLIWSLNLSFEQLSGFVLQVSRAGGGLYMERRLWRGDGFECSNETWVYRSYFQPTGKSVRSRF